LTLLDDDAELRGRYERSVHDAVHGTDHDFWEDLLVALR